MGVPPGNRPAVPRDWFRGVPERYVAGADTRGRQEGRPYPWSQQVIHEIFGVVQLTRQSMASWTVWNSLLAFLLSRNVPFFLESLRPMTKIP